MQVENDLGSLEVKSPVASREGFRQGRIRLPSELQAFWWASLAAVVLAVVVGWLKWRAGQSYFNWDPLSDRLFFDLMEYPGTYTLIHTNAFFFNVAGHPWPYPFWSAVAYPPFSAVVMAPMYAFPIPELLYMAVAGTWVLTAIAWVWRALLREGIVWYQAALLPFTVAAMSFPIARLIHQGNIELVVWIFTATGVWAFMRGRNNTAALLWGLAAAMKLFPLALLGIFLPRRHYRAFGLALATFAGATLASLWWLGPTIGVAWRGSLKNVFGYQGVRITEWSTASLATNHSLIELAKLAAIVTRYPMAKVSLPYYAACGLGMAFLFFRKLWRMPVANQLLALTVFMLIFPTISYYHTLVHMYAPLCVLGWVAIRAQAAGVTVPKLKATILLFVPLFASFTVLTFPRQLIFCGVVQSLLLLVLLLMSAQYPFEVPGNLGTSLPDERG